VDALIDRRRTARDVFEELSAASEGPDDRSCPVVVDDEAGRVAIGAATLWRRYAIWSFPLRRADANWNPYATASRTHARVQVHAQRHWSTHDSFRIAEAALKSETLLGPGVRFDSMVIGVKQALVSIGSLTITDPWEDCG
jgi:hypothetical protein